MLHDFLPVVVRGTLTPNVRETIYWLSQFFKWVCSKEVKIDQLEEMRQQGAELACHLEMYFPPGIFDIQVHLIVHLVDDLEYAG